MTTITATEQSIPTGTWALDTVHSTIGYAVRHSGVSLFKGSVESFEAALVDGVLRGNAPVTGITVHDENLQGHLLSPEFFDVERTPSVSFESTSIARDGDEITVDGELEIRGHKQPVTLSGTIAGPVGPDGSERIGLSLETTIDRTAFGINWQMELPDGGPVLDNEVKLTADLELVKG